MFNFVDNPPKVRGRQGAPGPGDILAFNAALTDSSGARAGSLDGSGVVTKGGRYGRAVGPGVLALTDGEIHVTVRFSTAAKDGETVSGAVVGGTGAYAGSSGTFVSVDRKGTAGGNPSDDTITLLP